MLFSRKLERKSALRSKMYWTLNFWILSKILEPSYYPRWIENSDQEDKRLLRILGTGIAQYYIES